uniref:Cytochrome P450 n=1 Tax=Ciona savignyi TaxID=51511 RepID=H2ZAJ4_CIOSA
MLEVHVSITAVAILVLIILLFLIGLLVYIYPGSSKETTVPGPDVSDAKDGNKSDIERAGSLHAYLCNLHADFKHEGAVSFHHGKQLVISISNPKFFAPRSQVFQLPSFLYEYWRPLIGEESFLFAKDIDVFRRRDYLDFKVNRNVKEFYAKIFRLLAVELETKWEKQPEDQHIPLTQHLKGLATKAVCQMMFGDNYADGTKVLELYRAWDKCWNEVMAASKMEPTKSESVEKKSISELRKLMENAIEERWNKSKSLDGITLLDGLLSSQTSDSKDQLTSEQLLCDVITMFTMGVQITTAVLCWSCYFVASNKEVQRK